MCVFCMNAVMINFFWRSKKLIFSATLCSSLWCIVFVYTCVQPHLHEKCISAMFALPCEHIGICLVGVSTSLHVSACKCWKHLLSLSRSVYLYTSSSKTNQKRIFHRKGILSIVNSCIVLIGYLYLSIYLLCIFIRLKVNHYSFFTTWVLFP